jgi:secondary thiamine-phosphate synthase enzyme
MIFLKNYYVNTTEEVDVISIIHEVNGAIKDSKIPNGIVNVIVTAPGGAVTILEPLTDIVDQFKQALEIFPGEGVETLSRRKEPIAVAPRIKAAMLGKSLHVPLNNGKLVLGPREEIILIDFEKNAKRREFFVQIMGEGAPQPPQGKPPMRR